MWSLISLTQCPPGEFSYVQTEGIRKSFPSSPLLGEQAGRVADFRIGNKLPRATAAEAIADIIEYTCARCAAMGCLEQYCYQTDQSGAQIAALVLPTGGCGSCGAKIE